MAWCRLVTSHYMSQYWLRSTLPYGVTKSQLFHGPESSIITLTFYKVRFIVINGEFIYLLKAEWCKYVQVNKPTLVQIMVCRLLAPSLYLNDNSGKVQSNAKFWFFFQDDTSKDVVWKTGGHLSWNQIFNTLRPEKYGKHFADDIHSRIFLNEKNFHLIHISITLFSWWRHQTEIFSVFPALCMGNSPVTGKFPSQRPVTSFNVFSDLRLNIRLGERSRRRWFETQSCSLWRHCNDPTNHFLNQCCFGFMMPYGVAMPWWLNE